MVNVLVVEGRVNPQIALHFPFEGIARSARPGPVHHIDGTYLGKKSSAVDVRHRENIDNSQCVQIWRRSDHV